MSAKWSLEFQVDDETDVKELLFWSDLLFKIAMKKLNESGDVEEIKKILKEREKRRERQ